jgi:hypothetical protein
LKVICYKLLSKFFSVCLLLEKIINKKYFPVKETFNLIFRKVFSFYFGWKTLFICCEKFKNILFFFVDYIKFDLQSFDCAIYFVLISRKFDLIFRKIFYFYFGWKTLSISCKKIQKYLIICWLYQIWLLIFWLLYILFWILFLLLFFNFFP